MFVDSRVGPTSSPASGNAIVPDGYIKQLEGSDGSPNILYQTLVPVMSGGPPPYANPVGAPVQLSGRVGFGADGH